MQSRTLGLEREVLHEGAALFAQALCERIVVEQSTHRLGMRVRLAFAAPCPEAELFARMPVALMPRGP